MPSPMPATIIIGLSASLLLAGCGNRQSTAYAEQSCAAVGPLYVVELESSAIAAEQQAVLANKKEVSIVDRASTLLIPTQQSLVFSAQMISFHGFGSSSQSVNYKDLSGITHDAENGTLIMDHVVISQDDGNRSVEEQQLPGISTGCYDHIVAFLNQQSVVM